MAAQNLTQYNCGLKGCVIFINFIKKIIFVFKIFIKNGTYFSDAQGYHV